MQKITTHQSSGSVYLSYGLDKAQQVNAREEELVNSGKVKSLLPLACGQAKNKRFINYNITGKIPLNQYLRELTNKEKFFQVVAGFVNVIRECNVNRMFIKNVLFDFQYIFVDLRDKSPGFVYLPVVDLQSRADIPSALLDIAFSSVFERMENNDYVAKYIGYFKTLPSFSLVEYEGFVKTLGGGLYKELTPAPDKPLEAKPEGERQAQPCPVCGTPLPDGAKFCPVCGRAALAETAAPDTGRQASPIFVPGPEQRSKSQEAPAPAAVAAQEEKPSPHAVTGRFSGTTVLGEDNAYGTSVLMEDELNSPRYPYLIRLKSNEKIILDKPVFRIGKEKSYVDYFVADNGAVSRSHADIIVKNGEYYILDHNSTNGTFINGERIAKNVEVKIVNGVRIRLANEEFDFHLN